MNFCCCANVNPKSMFQAWEGGGGGARTESLNVAFCPVSNSQVLCYSGALTGVTHHFGLALKLYLQHTDPGELLQVFLNMIMAKRPLACMH